nr:unnamed protein product [Leishmania braziliensis]
MSAYQSSNTAEARRAECARLQAKYPGHVAMVVEAAKSSKAHLLALPRDATVAELEAAVRQALGISAAKVTLAVEGCTPAATAAVGDVADACKHADGFLYVSVRGEQAMGVSRPWLGWLLRQRLWRYLTSAACAPPLSLPLPTPPGDPFLHGKGSAAAVFVLSLAFAACLAARVRGQRLPATSPHGSRLLGRGLC